MSLSENVCRVLEDNEFYGYDEISKNSDGTYYAEVGVYSPENEDVMISFEFDGTDEDFIKQFNEYVENFDIDDHAEMYIPMRGQNGVPDSISDLVEDAKWIKNTLTEVGSKLRDLENELEVEAER